LLSCLYIFLVFLLLGQFGGSVFGVPVPSIINSVFSRLFLLFSLASCQKYFNCKKIVKMDNFVKEKLREWNLSSLVDILEGKYFVSVNILCARATYCEKINKY
jgi:hypothetical protein